MPDPIDWGLVLESPVFWGALMALLGVLAGHAATRGNHREENELAGLRASVEALKGDYERLHKEVKELRDEVEGQRKRNRLLSEKYSASLVYAAHLQVLAAAHVAVPDPPVLIIEDFTHTSEGA